MDLYFRKAKAADLPALIELLANDKLGQWREDYRLPLPAPYQEAFREIDADPNQELVVAEDKAGRLVGTLQLTFLRYLNYQGGLRAQIESVRIHSSFRNRGLGRQLMAWAVARARQRGAHVVQLTSDKQRPEAIRFYEQLGFRATHEGFKLHLGHQV
ncbi:GNAT family N-acetyltransferase [Phaeodactylibacter luteus]|uniref:GNAT family N-acetyltransferase n=1 Tax=Phaeodactylibacter luteus TaxID=1564516 RepID=A0A5C6RFH9_9BACT|nr:GNAT family N-acetyltransferase [Phaeodactylibacter luteus]TXB59438.1 GNAT family N-acetyltransferase [Phaeodactylibacter luteus]